MKFSSMIRMGLIALAVCTLAACGSKGSNGSNGAPGAPGATGPAGPQGLPGADLTTGTVDSTNLTASDLQNRALAGKILSVDTSGVQPVVTFQVTMKDSGEGVRGLRTFSLHLSQLQPEVNGSASYWLNYLADGLPLASDPAATSAKFNPTTDSVSRYDSATGALLAQGYSVVDNGNGTYVVTFGAHVKDNTKVIYDAALTHRVVVGVRSVAVPGVVGKTVGAYAGPINPTTGAVFASFLNTNGVNLIADFTPAAAGPGTIIAAARDNVTIAACNQCHYKLEYGSNNTSGHFGSRPDTKTCVMCHTPQNTDGTGDFTPFIHQIHMGEELPVIDPASLAEDGAGASEFKYPQDIRNCAQCHKGTVTDSYKKPTLKACGSCHNNIDFSLGFAGGHIGGVKTDDVTCALCHTAADIGINHTPVETPDPNNLYLGGTNSNTNAAYLAAEGIVPTGATKISYVVSSVTKNASNNPVIAFKFQKKGPADAAPVDVVFNTYAPGAELMTGFVGSPSVYCAMSVPQDGIAAPADYNLTASSYIKNIWRGDGLDMKGVALGATSVGTLTGPVSGLYTLTLTGVKVPATAKMLTCGIGYTYSLSATQPLTQIDLAAYPYTPNAPAVNSGVGGTGGLSVPPANVWKVATGYTGRRLITDTAKCNTCHGALGVKPTFHAGQRNDAQTCTFCHTVNRTNSGWPVNINYDVHAIHGAGKRTNKFSWEFSAGAKFWEVGYPGILKNCEQCHLPNTYDFSASTSASAVTSLLPTSAANGLINAAGIPITLGTEVSTTVAISPFVTAGQNYGPLFSYVLPGVAAAAYTLSDGSAGSWTDLATGLPVASLTAVANTAGAVRQAEGTTLVLSPISAACSGCHDTATARAHMVSNGGTVFGTRASTVGKTEQCLVCHGAVSTTNITNNTTPAIKAIHRWW